LNTKKKFNIAVFPGDGIGNELIDACIKVLQALEKSIDGFHLTHEFLQAGAAYYQRTGMDITAETMAKARQADAILLGAMGLPTIRYPDGTEIAPHLKMRTEFNLYAGVRPVKVYPNVPTPLADKRASEIDMIILRESTEGLFASVGKGEVIDDREARETLVITRQTCEKLFKVGFEMALRRKAKDGKGRVTCVDKANVFRAYAFFRKVFKESAAQFPEVAVDFNYVDAMALDMVRRPWDFDVVVAENMFADILSDLGGGIVGGMGMASCAELGDAHGLFQPAHGSAPDIAGTDRANPIATFLSAGMMLEWLGMRHANHACQSAADKLEKAVEKGFAAGRIQPMEFGGPHGTQQVTDAVIELIEKK